VRSAFVRASRNRFVSPDAHADPTRFLGSIRALGEVVVFPTPRRAAHLIARHLGDLEVLAPFPDWEILERVQSKRAQLDQALAAGVDVPQTHYPGPRPRLGRPQRRSDCRCSSNRNIPSASSNASADRRSGARRWARSRTPYTQAEEFGAMVQELIPGEDDALYTVGSYVARDGRPLGVFSGRKLRQTPPGIGTCRVGEAIWVQAAVDAALRLLEAFDYFGLSQVEFKRDPRDGKFKLMEIQSASVAMARARSACGIDLPRIALCGPRRRETERGHDERGRQALGDHTAAGRAPGPSQRPPYVDAVFARDDPKPAGRPSRAGRAECAPIDSRRDRAPRPLGVDSIGARGPRLRRRPARTRRMRGSRSNVRERPEGDDVAEGFFPWQRVERRKGSARRARRFRATSGRASTRSIPARALRRRLGVAATPVVRASRSP